MKNAFYIFAFLLVLFSCNIETNNNPVEYTDVPEYTLDDLRKDVLEKSHANSSYISDLSDDKKFEYCFNTFRANHPTDQNVWILDDKYTAEVIGYLMNTSEFLILCRDVDLSLDSFLTKYPDLHIRGTKIPVNT